ncbi:hypothetical protein EKO27_g6195 [Xylaria grammica]|uniref:Ketopantoate reductase C-terminal domain-containing protein n=1 Tax=Xylaria grammica TaxID=363999 RepID=A0A439D3A0_9PEZI|nr:hypothetical protein EKO27_g6195 [Xylaria grammica]
MRVTRLSTPASTLRRQFVGMCGIPLRPMHSSARMRNINNPCEIPAEWLGRIMADNTTPPKLYAWTPKDLSAKGRTKPESGQDSRTGMEPNKRNEEERRRIYILGVGNIGRLYAMCLSKLAHSPPITLVVHRKELLERWAAEPGIELTRHGRVQRNVDFDVEWWADVAPDGNDGAEVAAGGNIGNLIVATKASDAVPQVDRVRRYLGGNSTVAFVQNGMCKLWPPLGDVYVGARFADGNSPNWIACVTTHGVTSQGPFKSIHAAPANALVGPVMSGRGSDMGAGYLMRLIAKAPDLDAQEVSRKQLWVAQLEKLVVNAVINPLTAVLRCKNGEIFIARDDAIPDIINKLLSEASETLGALVLSSRSEGLLLSESACEGTIPENLTAEFLRATREQLLGRFSFPRLRGLVLDVGVKVGSNTSSMLQDLQAGKPTEVDDFNGWLVDTARLLDKGLQLPTHEKLIGLVKAKAKLTRNELCAEILSREALLKADS